jgi:NAD(P)-dependent dehydrogenase (short-subunit alcohol dehydrogenase family)
MKDIEDKVILITGGAGGMGRIMVETFANQGARDVVFLDYNAKAGQALAKRIKRDTVLFVPGDVSKAKDCEKAAAAARGRFGRIDVLINNAALGELATGRERRPFWKFDPAGFRRLMDININGVFHMSQAVVPGMIKQGWGRIIMLSKRRESMYAPLISAYGSSKAAVDAMMMAWAVELQETGVTVNSMNPGGGVDTAFMTAKQRRSGRAAGTILQPEVIIAPALFLASNASDGITGCRYVGERWNEGLPPRQAAEQARDPAIFRAPGKVRPSKLKKTFTEPAKVKRKSRRAVMARKSKAQKK